MRRRGLTLSLIAGFAALAGCGGGGGGKADAGDRDGDGAAGTMGAAGAAAGTGDASGSAGSAGGAGESALDGGSDGDASVEAAVTEAGPDAPETEAGQPCELPGAWRPLGVPPSPSHGSTWPTFALLPDGSPVVSWVDDALATHTRVWKPSGCDGTWEPMGDPVAKAAYPVMTVPATTGQPVRAYMLGPAPYKLIVERWNGTAFVGVGDPIDAQTNSSESPSIAADADGNLVVAWVIAAFTASSRVGAARWNGTSWVALSDGGGILGSQLGNVVQRSISIAFTPEGTPVLAWPTTPFVTVVAKLVSGTTWTTLGTPPPAALGSGGTNGPVVKINHAGEIFLCSMNRVMPSVYRTSVARYDGTAWQPVGGPLGTLFSDIEFDMAIDDAGAPIVVNAEREGGTYRLQTYRWVGGAWQSLVPGATDGVPAGSYVALPRIALDGSGRLFVAWEQNDVAGAARVVVARGKL